MPQITIPRLVTKQMQPKADGSEGQTLVLQHVGPSFFLAVLEDYPAPDKALALEGSGRSLRQALEALEGKLLRGDRYQAQDVRLVVAK